MSNDPADYSEQEQQLIARGVLTPPLRKRKPSDALPGPVGNIPDGVMDQIWREEREDRCIVSVPPTRGLESKGRNKT